MKSFCARRCCTLSPETTPLDPLFETRKPWRDIWAAGHGVGLIRDVPSVAELVERIRHEYDEAVERLHHNAPKSANHHHHHPHHPQESA